MEASRVLDRVKHYYGKVLEGSKDLRTSACCGAGTVPSWQREVLALLEPEILERFYGCGSPIPEAVEGCTVLDLGCGTGRDAYVVAKLVGPSGRVIGVDMTEEQIEVARRHVGTHMERFGFPEPNVEFRLGYIEDLAAAGVGDESVDVVISNCVINLSPDKEQVFSEIFRVLKPGGELLFSDVFALRRVPAPLREDPVLLGECLAGALYVEDFRRLLARLGYPDYRVVSCTPLALEDPEVEAKIGMVEFVSMTVRVFKLGDLEDRCEDYGQVAVYRGTIPGHPHRFALDSRHVFRAGRPEAVCGNTASILDHTRFGRHFRVMGDRSVHYGLFPCTPTEGPPAPADETRGCC